MATATATLSARSGASAINTKMGFRGCRRSKSQVPMNDNAFALRDIYLKGWSGLDSVELAKMAVDVLVDAGWLRPMQTGSGSEGGRPRTRYAVNPKVRE
jgi:hypothetical protein